MDVIFVGRYIWLMVFAELDFSTDQVGSHTGENILNTAKVL